MGAGSIPATDFFGAYTPIIPPPDTFYIDKYPDS